MAAIGTPSYISWANNQRVGAARSQIASALRKAQAQARATKLNREVRFDNNGGNPRIAIIPAVNNTTGLPKRLANNDPSIVWIPLNQEGKKGVQLRLDPISPYQTAGVVDNNELGGIVFDPYGAIATSNAGNTFGTVGQNDARIFAIQVGVGPQAKQNKRCILVRTLLGSLKEDQGGNCPNI
jgi:Tfp pilus assembly protein FimT